MKKYTSILLLLLLTTAVFSQRKEKIKGSKTVTKEHREVGKFSVIEVNGSFEVYLEKGEKPEINIEADDNLIQVINLDLIKDTLHITSTKKITSFKKLLVKITYTNNLKKIISKDDSEVNAIQELQLDDVTIQTLNNSKFYMNVNARNFILLSDDKSKVELNLKSEMAKIILSKDALLKSLINSTNLDCDIYQKATANIEGTIENAKIRVDHNSNFIGNKLTIKNATVIAENNSKSTINAADSIIVEASNKAEIKIVGNPKIEMQKFADEAKLIKSPK